MYVVHPGRWSTFPASPLSTYCLLSTVHCPPHSLVYDRIGTHGRCFYKDTPTETTNTSSFQSSKNQHHITESYGRHRHPGHNLTELPT